MEYGKEVQENLRMRINNVESAARTMLDTGVYQGTVKLIEGFSNANRSLIKLRR